MDKKMRTCHDCGKELKSNDDCISINRYRKGAWELDGEIVFHTTCFRDLAGDDYVRDWKGVIQAVDELLPGCEIKEGRWIHYKK